VAILHLKPPHTGLGCGRVFDVDGMLSSPICCKEPQVAESKRFRKALIRSTYMFSLGLLLLFLCWGPAQVWDWDILTLIGLSTMIVYGCRFLSTWQIIACSVSILLVTPWLRSMIDADAHWGQGPFIPSPVISDVFPNVFFEPANKRRRILHKPIDVLHGFLLGGLFPIFPWAMFPLVGVIMGRRVVANRFHYDLPGAIFVGAMFIAIGLVGVVQSLWHPDASPITSFLAPLSLHPNSFTMSLLQLGIGIIVISLTYYVYDCKQFDESQISCVARMCQRTGRYALTLYVLHYLIIAWPLMIVNHLTGKNRIFDFMDAGPAFIISIVVIVCFEYMISVFDQIGCKFTMEGLLANLTARSVLQEQKVMAKKQHTGRDD